MQRELQYDIVFDAQEHFRLLLDAMARPGEIRVLPIEDLTPPDGIHAAAALVGFALLNADVSFYATGLHWDAITRYLTVHTSAAPEIPEKADFWFMSGADHPENANADIDGFAGGGSSAAYYTGLLARAKRGSLSYPEDSATLVVSVAQLSVVGGSGANGHGLTGGSAAPNGHGAPAATVGSAVLTLQGPGIASTNTLLIKGIHTEFLSEWRRQNEEFPLGIDLILADETGRIAAIPRSTKVNHMTVWDM
jgi:alpha-D-ribose 1-methylphosphonate 5-triphosphate synthase subunit PhnH